MCWNKNVSIATFILAIIGVYYLYQRNGPNDRWVALFAGTVAMIQLAEYFMWTDQTCSNINKYASIFALLVLVLEPLTNMMGGIYFSNTPYKNILKYMLFAYIIFIAYTYFTEVYDKQINWCGTSLCNDIGTSGLSPTETNSIINTKACNLQWFFLNTMSPRTAIIWTLFLMLPFLTMTPMYQGIIILALGIITKTMASSSKGAATGSLWCWYAIGLILVKILM